LVYSEVPKMEVCWIDKNIGGHGRNNAKRLTHCPVKEVNLGVTKPGCAEEATPAILKKMDFSIGNRRSSSVKPVA